MAYYNGGMFDIAAPKYLKTIQVELSNNRGKLAVAYDATEGMGSIVVGWVGGGGGMPGYCG